VQRIGPFESPLLNQVIGSLLGLCRVVVPLVEALIVWVVMAQQKMPDFMRNHIREFVVVHPKHRGGQIDDGIPGASEDLST